jgi:hypothetical protein
MSAEESRPRYERLYKPRANILYSTHTSTAVLNLKIARHQCEETKKKITRASTSKNPMWEDNQRCKEMHTESVLAC